MVDKVRPEVIEFLALGPLPSSADAEVRLVEELTEALMRIQRPVSRDEAILLAGAFGPDDCFGLAWTLVHLIETAPGGIAEDALVASDGEWIALLRGRAARGQGSGT